MSAIQLANTYGRWPAKQCQWFINQQKDEGLRAANLEHFGDEFTKTMISV
jgi:DNA helicase-2/ATP-dependent DNA helicase PcrA